MRRGPVAAALALMLAALGAVGCGGTFTAATSPGPVVYGYSAVSVDSVPMAIESYPSVYWNGAPAYLVDDSWYYRSGGGWVVLQQEPRDLYRYRIAARPRSVEYRYSPAYRGSPTQDVAPAYRPPYRGSPVPVYSAPAYGRPVQSAPPAYRPPVHTAPPVVRPPVRTAPPVYRSAPPPRRGNSVHVAPPAPRGSSVQSAPPVIREYRRR